MSQTNENTLEDVLKSDVPKIYFNGFSTFMGNSDVVIVLQNNGQPTAVLNTSFTIAKTLVQRLNDTITYLEKSSGNAIMTTDQVDQAISKIQNEKK